MKSDKQINNFCLMNLLFVGGFFPEQFTTYILNKSKLQVQNAANSFQWAFIKGLEQNLKSPIKLITAPFIGWYPKYYSDLFCSAKSFLNNEDLNSGFMVGFINLPIIKNIFRFFNLYSAITKFLSHNEQNVLIVYSIDFSILKAAISVKRRNPNTSICVIITDCYDWKENKSYLHKLKLKNVFKPLPLKLLSEVDCFVVLTDKMVDYLKLGNKPWVRIEGLYNDNRNNHFASIHKDTTFKIVLYTGTLEYPYGILELLEAFKLIKSEDYRLWICGSGSGSQMVINCAKADERITYYGIVDRQKIDELQSKATILVNPRNTIGEYNKYSFPSKTMEYLASGTPALLYKLDGIPDEYFDYCYTVEDNKVESLAKAIFDICQLDPTILKSKGLTAREFIIKNKNSTIQCNKVLEMITKLNNKKLA